MFGFSSSTWVVEWLRKPTEIIYLTVGSTFYVVDSTDIEDDSSSNLDQGWVSWIDFEHIKTLTSIKIRW